MPLMHRVVDFLERRTGARPLAVARIIIGCAAILRGLASYHLADRVLNPGVLRARPFEWIPDMSREMLPYYIGAWLLTATAFTVGYRTRLNGAILFALIVYHLAVGQTFFWSHIYFLCCLILLLAVADAGVAFSLDAQRRNVSPPTVPQWGVTLLKLHVTIVYFISALAKLNSEFLSGDVLGRGLSRPEFIHEPSILLALAWATIAFEFGMAFVVWIKPLRLWAFASGVMFHTLILLTMGFYAGLIVFSASIVGTYVLFLDEEEFAAAESIWKRLSLFFSRRLAQPTNLTS